MPTATREPYTASAKLPRLRTTYQITVSSPSPSPLTSMSPHQRPRMPLGTSRELPMPTVTRITSLGQAQATLHHCSTKLSKSQNIPGRDSPPGSPIDAADRRQAQQWLERWERAFTAYLSQSMASMKTEEIAHCRVLKANHLACMVLASDAASNPASFDAFEAEYQAIVELARAVMQLRSQRSDVSGSTDTNSLDIREPLYVVVARCGRVSVRNTAIQLLSKLGSR